jgi:hypothetical protein
MKPTARLSSKQFRDGPAAAATEVASNGIGRFH